MSSPPLPHAQPDIEEVGIGFVVVDFKDFRDETPGPSLEMNDHPPMLRLIAA